MIQPILLTIALCSVIFFFVKEVRRLAADIIDILADIIDILVDIRDLYKEADDDRL